MKSIERKVEKLEARKAILSRTHNKNELKAITRRVAALKSVLTTLAKDSYWADQCIQAKAIDTKVGEEFIKNLQSHVLK